MSSPPTEETLASLFSLTRERQREMSDTKIRRIKLNHSTKAGSVINKHVSSDTHKGEDNSSGNTMLEVKLEKQEPEDGLLEGCGILKRKRLSRGPPFGRKSRRIAELGDISLEAQRFKQPGSRWNSERIKFAEQALADVLKEKGASFETPLSRFELRTTARKKIGDTGLLDHSLKHFDGKVTPGGAHRFRRCYNTDGTMQFWLESADLIKIKRESGTVDPNWIPPPWWKNQTASHESSAALSKLFSQDIEKLKSDMKELQSKQKLPDPADATEKLCKDLMSWSVKADKQIIEISNSLTSTQCMFKELMAWKDKTELQLVGISNSLNNLQANGSTSFSPAPESWEQILQSTKLDDFTGNGFEPWDDLIDVLPDAIRLDTYSVPPNPCKNYVQNDILGEEKSLPNIEMPRTESCMTRGESRSSNQDKAQMTAGQKSDIDGQNIHSQETLKELLTWKAKVEQRLTDISKTVHALHGQSAHN